MTHNERVLRDLKQRKSLGVSALDYPKGFRLGARIFDLREHHDIVGRKDGSKPLFRYYYIGKRGAK